MLRTLPLLVTICLLGAVTAAGAEPASPALLEESRALANRITTQVRDELVRELERTGPIRAITVCKYSVPEITSNLSRQTGQRITRVALRPRNRALAEPDAWEQRVLLGFEKRIAKGEKADALEFHEIVVEPAGRAFRYMKSIAVSQPCMACHGPVGELSEGVRAQLQLDYPNDEAVEYRLGQLRGAISVKKPL
jgi:hypothetical protein